MKGSQDALESCVVGVGGGGKLYMSELAPSLGNTFLADRTDVGAYRRGLNDSRVLGPAIL